ncbi:MAG TPA: transcriptional regulator [Clostridiales bacterium]|nr:transcriptional regulator [Clostridiales bacterium]
MTLKLLSNPKVLPPLDPTFKPAILEKIAYEKLVKESGKEATLKIAVERNGGLVSVKQITVFADDAQYADYSCFYAERYVKTLLWVMGGRKIYMSGPEYICQYLKKAYSPGGLRDFDVRTMSRIFEKPFETVITDDKGMPAENEQAVPLGRHLNGCRIGFDAGGSDRKVSAVIDGESVYSEEVVWFPKLQTDPDYHYEHILSAFKTAAEHMPRVDAIGVSSAGVYVDNRAMIASLFIKVPDDLFEKKVKDIYLRAAKEIGDVPIEVANDGDVTALAGAMSLEDNGVLGIAMGTSEAGGYVNENGFLTGWLNELAFVPVDFSLESMVDEWSGDFGCGVKYFSQDGVIKLAPAAKIELDESLSPAEKLKIVQTELENGNKEAEKIFKSIGVYLGYALAYYAEFYKIKHLLVMGRVTSGKGGDLLINNAKKVLDMEFPELARQVELHLPDEKSRRVGQSIAAASLPEIR